MRIFDVEYHFYRTWRKLRFFLLKKWRLRSRGVSQKYKRKIGEKPPPIRANLKPRPASPSPDGQNLYNLKAPIFLLSRVKIGLLILILLLVLFYSLLNFSQRLENRDRVFEVDKTREVQNEVSSSGLVLVTKIPDAVDVPVLTAKAAFLVESTTGLTLFESNADGLLPPASITKILTAILALENYQLDETIVVPTQCVGLEGTLIGLQAGEVWTVEEMLYGMLVPSASDATCALASRVSQVTDYVAAMNLRAQALGLNSTRFANPIGLEDPEHRSNARDLVALGRLAMQDPVIRKIVSTKEIDLHGRKIVSTNELLGQLEGLVGVKTGFTAEAGECLLFAVERGERKILGVVLGSEDRFGEAKKLIDWVYQTHLWTK